MIITALLVGSVGIAGITIAQTHTATMDHGSMNHDPADLGDAAHDGILAAPVREPGQGAFAAIAEIVAKLEADPNTDWSKVNIAGLRAHLRDMNVVTIDAVAVAKDVRGGVEFIVTGAADVAPSIRRMTIAHADVMSGIHGWQYVAEETDDGARITVIVPQDDLAKVKALGFFGVMALGSHHQTHHWMMASGRDPHD